jgi:oligopeptide/dipeptide ABC transporter ATP-binding protein
VGGSEDSFIEVRGLRVSYRSSGARALDGIHLEMRASEVLGVVGESGCGKSTLANALLRLLPPNAKHENGEILFRKRDLLSLSESELRAIRGREISLVPQDPALALNPVMTAGSQIAEVLRAHLPLTARQRKDRVKELLRAVGFEQPDDIYHAYPHQLSGGQRQRVVIAQAVACCPALVIADEPTSKLDAPLRSEMVDLLSAIRHQHGTAILAISHDPTLFAGFADRIAVMYAGRIVESGTCAEIFGEPLHPYTQALVQIGKSARGERFKAHDRFETIAGEPPDSALTSLGCPFEPRCSQRMDICTRECPDLVTLHGARSVSCFKYAQ